MLGKISSAALELNAVHHGVDPAVRDLHDVAAGDKCTFLDAEKILLGKLLKQVLHRNLRLDDLAVQGMNPGPTLAVDNIENVAGANVMVPAESFQALLHSLGNF